MAFTFMILKAATGRFASWHGESYTPTQPRCNARHQTESTRHVLAQLVEPHGRFRIARGTPVAAWRKGAAGADFGTVGNRRALELACLEEAVEEHLQPLLDGGQ